MFFGVIKGDKILLAQVYKIRKWSANGCQKVARRRERCSDEEKDLMGWSVKEYNLRDGYLKLESKNRED
jgi:hypothetical protein